MFSLIFWTILVCILLPISAWVLAWSARAAGSSRGTLRNGLLTTLAMVGLNVFLLVVVKSIGSQQPPTRQMSPYQVEQLMQRQAQRQQQVLLFSGVLTIVQLIAIYFMLKAVFALPSGRAFVPFGVNLGMGLLSSALIFGVVRPFISESFVMPTLSMSPTLEPGDGVMANKLRRHPKRFDLVVYRNHDREEHRDDLFVKRLVALPGERLRFENGSLYINDQLLPVPHVLTGKCHAFIGNHRGAALYDEKQTITLAPNEYFFLGDDIEISGDSRYYGPTAQSDLVGVVDLIYWPPRKIRIIP